MLLNRNSALVVSAFSLFSALAIFGGVVQSASSQDKILDEIIPLQNCVQKVGNPGEKLPLLCPIPIEKQVGNGKKIVTPDAKQVGKLTEEELAELQSQIALQKKLAEIRARKADQARLTSVLFIGPDQTVLIIQPAGDIKNVTEGRLDGGTLYFLLPDTKTQVELSSSAVMRQIEQLNPEFARFINKERGINVRLRPPYNHQK